MTKHETITQLLHLSTRLEAKGNYIDALACATAAAEMMLLPTRRDSRELEEAIAEGERLIKATFDRFQASLDTSYDNFEDIIRNAYPDGGPQS